MVIYVHTAEDEKQLGILRKLASVTKSDGSTIIYRCIRATKLGIHEMKKLNLDIEAFLDELQKIMNQQNLDYARISRNGDELAVYFHREKMKGGVTKPLEKQIEWFNRYVQETAKPQQFTWCPKTRDLVLTKTLKGEDCCLCELFVLNGGWCDPL